MKKNHISWNYYISIRLNLHKVLANLNLCKILLPYVFSKSLFYSVTLLWFDPLGVFHLFIMMVADIIAPKLSIIFYELIRPGSFPECWRFATVTAIPSVLHP